MPGEVLSTTAFDTKYFLYIKIKHVTLLLSRNVIFDSKCIHSTMEIHSLEIKLKNVLQDLEE